MSSSERAQNWYLISFVFSPAFFFLRTSAEDRKTRRDPLSCHFQALRLFANASRGVCYPREVEERCNTLESAGDMVWGGHTVQDAAEENHLTYGPISSTPMLQRLLKKPKPKMRKCTPGFSLSSRPVTKLAFLCHEDKTLAYCVLNACYKHGYVEVRKLCEMAITLTEELLSTELLTPQKRVHNAKFTCRWACLFLLRNKFQLSRYVSCPVDQCKYVAFISHTMSYSRAQVKCLFERRMLTH